MSYLFGTPVSSAIDLMYSWVSVFRDIGPDHVSMRLQALGGLAFRADHTELPRGHFNALQVSVCLQGAESRPLYRNWYCLCETVSTEVAGSGERYC